MWLIFYKNSAALDELPESRALDLYDHVRFVRIYLKAVSFERME